MLKYRARASRLSTLLLLALLLLSISSITLDLGEYKHELFMQFNFVYDITTVNAFGCWLLS